MTQTSHTTCDQCGETNRDGRILFAHVRGDGAPDDEDFCMDCWITVRREMRDGDSHAVSSLRAELTRLKEHNSVLGEENVKLAAVYKERTPTIAEFDTLRATVKRKQEALEEMTRALSRAEDEVRERVTEAVQRATSQFQERTRDLLNDALQANSANVEIYGEKLYELAKNLYQFVGMKRRLKYGLSITVVLENAGLDNSAINAVLASGSPAWSPA